MQIFLCHSSSDKKYVRGLCQRLISDGYEVWLDEVNLIPGQEWDPEIRKQVRKSDIVLVCLSNSSSNKEGYVQREIKIAVDEAETKPEGTIYIVPARIEPCNIPNRLTKWQWVDLFEENGYSKLKLALSTREAQVALKNELGASAIQLANSPFASIPMPKRKRIFTQLEKDRFAKQAFHYITTYFQRALQELQNSDPDLQTEFDSISALRFTSKVYFQGNIKTKCSIWLGDDLISNTIYYNEGINQIDDKAINDYLPVADNGEELGLQVGNYAFSMTFRTDASQSTQQQAAEHLWKRFISRLEDR